MAEVTRLIGVLGRGTMNRGEVFRQTGASLTTAALGSMRVAASRPARPPDGLFLLVDQQRFGTLRVYGNSKIMLPNLNRLADQSAVFSQIGGASGRSSNLAWTRGPALAMPFARF